MRSVRIDAAGRTHAGRVRPTNEDAFTIARVGGRTVLAVADGLGGHAAGEVASALGVATFVAALRSRPRGEPLDAAVHHAVMEADRAILACATDERTGMGTTLTALVVAGGQAVVAHIGDSRLYRWRDGGWEQLTRDHSLAVELAAAGVEERGRPEPDRPAAAWPGRHVLTRALGSGPSAEVDVAPVDLRPGDRLVLCTDGLCGAVPDEAIATIVAEHAGPAAAAQRLAALGDAHGADNVTAVVASVHPAPMRRRAFALLGLALALLLGVGLAGLAWSRSAFLGLADGEVVVYRGVPLRVAGVPLYRVERRTGVSASAIPEPYRNRLREGVLLARPEDADPLLRDLLVGGAQTPPHPPAETPPHPPAETPPGPSAETPPGPPAEPVPFAPGRAGPGQWTP